ncbi:hypothetical protein LP109_08070 [Moraxella bovis]|uniref:Uncharacterized protein n=1 Tax=Moraxella bovis TaxID=476 RepID=A0AAX3EXI4_MORBO|nr:hypothetical protein [Moraxella bovis]OOR91409.1 hypothetical protein B0182_02880 [Moraxella bovis]UYZ78100.1 hypothetical protein LP115_12810 [Moraxella bovis]UYZ79275.1 hypothetical protein LP115_05435 [Moraxella bovis]UYZ87755.1 hypothetical protein LP094_05440 [Moraxella bovis]UZA15625.1 hypothetical protein LP109_08070 [Moraxella bovis]
MRTGEQQSEQGNAWLATWLARFFINLWNTKMKSISFQKSFQRYAPKKPKIPIFSEIYEKTP